MRATYLQTNSIYPFCDCFVKITDKKVTTVRYTSIDIEDLENDFDVEVDWFIDNWNMTESTKEKFDELYIKIAKEINESINN